MKKRLLFLTGTRADFGKLKPLIRAVDDDDSFEYDILATGMHMIGLYGLTVDEIYKAGFKRARIFTYQNQMEGDPMEVTLANTIQVLSRHLARWKPDLMIVHGDRVETLAGAISGAFCNIRVAHIEGGEVSGTIDEHIRHAVSKLSHMHFVCNARAAQRLEQIGEAPNSIFVIGSPDIDIMLSKELPTLDQVRERFEIKFPAYGIVLFHPVLPELEMLKEHAETLVEVLLRSRRQFVVIYPNNDRGSHLILEAYRRLENNPNFRVFPSMRFEYFISLLKGARMVLGNSSLGVREAPVFGVPSVNIGTRQCNRFCHESIVNVSHNRPEILLALNECWNSPRFKPCHFFGDGRSARRFMDAIHNPLIWNISQQKLFIDRELMPAFQFSYAAGELQG
ncbi:UDP-N-acetylglucosamine 2-epimerase [Syntrophobacter sp. SbD1]|nr:UDP-N-acetylglucosamine 2-epimerase [Syntrophobacter sp. SbD1]